MKVEVAGKMVEIPDDYDPRKTDEEYMIEQSYIKQLVSEESRSTMEVLVENGQVLDEETVICFTDFLNGYTRNGNKRIPFSATNIQ